MAETTSRLKIAAPLIAMLVLLAAWSGWWWFASNLAQTKFAEARATHADRFGLACASEGWSGYPYRIMFTCTDAVIDLKRPGTTIRSAKLDILAQAYNPSHIIARLTGPSEIENPRQGLMLTTEHLPLVTGVKFKSGQFAIASSRISDLTVKQDGEAVLTVKSATLHLRPAESRPGFDVAADASDVIAMPGKQTAIPFERVEASGNFDKLPPGGHRNLSELARAVAVAGTLFTLDGFAAKTSGVSATASGAISINQQGKLTGGLTTRLQNLDKLLTELTARGVVKEKQAKAASTLLGLFKTPDGIAADLRFKDGNIYWGPIKLGRHAPLF